jgi:hypothetical protein
LHKRLSIAAYVCLASSIPLSSAGPSYWAACSSQQPGTSNETPKEDAPAKKSPDGTSSAKKSPGRAKAAKKKSGSSSAAKKSAAPDTVLEMEPGIICKTIDGYEDYEPLPGAAQTSDEKLLVYIRPSGFQSEKLDKGYQAHLTLDGEVRKRGTKTILRQKKKLLDYKPVYTAPPVFVYLKHAVSLKGLVPGDYDLTIILHDEIAKGGAVATQVVKFKIIPPLDPSKVKEDKASRPPGDLDSLYAPFLEFKPENDK